MPDFHSTARQAWAISDPTDFFFEDGMIHKAYNAGGMAMKSRNASQSY